eukprot:m.24318 g.24318  ORF g.24318 m.24318 type:complete len:453 (+) comp28603_c0_seq4:68-1426(+)
MSEPRLGFATAYTYENVFEPTGYAIEPTRGDVWLHGRMYDVSKAEVLKEVKDEIKGKLWFTYRKKFRAIGGTGPTTDAGWGCTMRCGQMLLAQALMWRHLGQEWKWKPKELSRKYNQILSHFLDQPDALYSIQQIAQCGVDFNRRIGEWFGPNNMCHVIRKLSQFDDWSSLTVHVAMDMTVIIKEIKDNCYKRDSSVDSTTPTFSPLLLFIPLRPGQERIRDEYREALKACFRMRQSLGMIGGKPKHALWFFGYQGVSSRARAVASGQRSERVTRRKSVNVAGFMHENRVGTIYAASALSTLCCAFHLYLGNHLLCLDPHTVQATVNPQTKAAIPDETFHCSRVHLHHIRDLDPSISLGFFCQTEADVDDMFAQLKSTVVGREPPLFEIFAKRPRNMPPLVDPRPSRPTDQRIEESFTDLSSDAAAAAAVLDGDGDDDEYDIIDPTELADMH